MIEPAAPVETVSSQQPQRFSIARVWRQPALLLSIAYVFTSAIGLWSSYWFYQQFDVQILQFMEVTDFLAAGLRDPAYFLIVTGAVLLSWMLTWPERWAARNPERVERLMRRWWWRWFVTPHWHHRFRDKMGQVPPIIWVLVGIVWTSMWILFGYVIGQAKDIMRGGGRVVKLSAEPDVREGMCASPRLVGTTSLYVFLYCIDSHTVEVLPIESVGRLTLATDKPRPAPLKTAAPPSETKP